MTTKSIYKLLVIVILLGLVAAGCERPSSNPGGGGGGPVSWIDKPLNGSSFPLGDIEIIAHSNDPAGVSQVEISANGQVIATLPGSGAMVTSTHIWKPVEEGNYVLHVRSQGGSGWGGYAEVTIQVGNPTPTPPSLVLPVCDVATPTSVCPTLPPTPIGFIPPPPPVCGDPTLVPPSGVLTATLAKGITPTLAEALPTLPCISPTPTKVGLPATQTPVGPTLVAGPVCQPTPTLVCITPTPTTVKSGEIIFTHQVSDSQIYYGGCNPGQVTISVAVSDPPSVRSVILFTRLEDKESGEQTPWDEGTSMNPAGTGNYRITIGSESVPNYNTYDNAWLIYQFVATDTKEEVIARSSRIYDVTLSTCGSPPAAPPAGITPVRPPPSAPPLFPVAP